MIAGIRIDEPVPHAFSAAKAARGRRLGPSRVASSALIATRVEDGLVRSGGACAGLVLRVQQLHGHDDLDVVHALTVNPWKKFGHSRLYVSEVTGQTVGWLDLKTGASKLEMPSLAQQFDAALLDYFGVAAQGTNSGAELSMARASASPIVAVVRPRPPVTPAPCEDLARRVPGQKAAAEAERLRQQAPVASALGRVLGFATEDRSWRVGATGERKVAEQLDRLQRSDPRWCALHSIPVGERDSDIDHVVIGPGGVFTLNTKHHPGKRLSVRGEAFFVDGHRQPYVRNSRHEAQRAARLLSQAVGFAVPVQGVVVPVGANSLEVTLPPADVAVVACRQLVSWFERLYPVLPPPAVAAVFDAARRSTTWSARWRD